MVTFSFPARVRFDVVCLAVLTLFGLHLITGTDVLFAQLVCLFCLVACWTVNQLGGLRQLSGLCVALMALKMVVISQITKLILGERGDSHLDQPIATAGVLLVGMTSVGFAAWLARGVSWRRPLMRTDNSPRALRLSAWLTFAVGLASYLGSYVLGGIDGGTIRVGGVVGLMRQFTFCLPLSIAFGTACVVSDSGGRRVLGWLNGLPIAVAFGFGALYSSKQGMYEPFLIAGVTAAAYGLVFRVRHLVTMIGVGLFSILVLYPFAQVSRSVTRSADFGATVRDMRVFLERHFTSVRGFQELLIEQEQQEESDELSYYSRPQALLDRLSLIKMVDRLVAATLAEGTSGWETVMHGFKMLLPRAVNPGKPAIGTGAVLGQKAQVLSEDDASTQISFGFIADAFSAFGWWGAAIIPALLTLSFFIVFRALTGSIEANAWCVFLFSQFQHTFTELPIAGMTLCVFQQPLIYFFTYRLLQWAVCLQARNVTVLTKDHLRSVRETLPTDRMSTIRA